MAKRQLYALSFFDDDLQREGIQANRQQSRQGQLTDGPPQVRFIASEPGERRLRGHFDGLYADVMGSEMRELLAAGDIRQVPYYVVNESVPWEGYYAPSRTDDADRAEPTTESVQSFDGVLDFEGTNESHLREVSVSNSTVTNPYGSASTQTLFLANSSTGAKWISQKGDQIEDATVQATHNAEREDFDEFDATEPAFSGNESYALVYDVAYDDEWQSDPIVWDDHDRNQTVDNISPTWARVYDAGHSYNGSKVVETGRMRLLPVPESNSFTAQQWNDTSSQYENVSLGTSDWQLTAWDNRRIGLERIRARTAWENSSDTSESYELEAEVLRGQNETHFYVPENANTTEWHYEVDNAVFNNDIDTQDTGPTGMAWNNDGTRLYEVGTDSDKIYESDVSTAYDITTASPLRNISTQDTGPAGVAWNDDGSKLYEVGQTDEKIYESEVSDPYNISSATVARNASTQDTTPRGMAWNDEGTKLYEVGGDNDSIYESELSEAFNVSTATFQRNISTQDDAPHGIAWNDDGSKLYEIGSTSNLVYEYDVSEAYNVSTATFSQSADTQSEFPTGMAWNNDGSKLYEVGNEATDNKIYESDVVTPNELVTLLEPIAMDTDEALGEEARLRERSEVPDE